jgi:phosphatidylserine decarboxylase
MHAYTRFIGALSRIRLPRGFRGPILSPIARALDLDLLEAEHPCADYSSFQELFVRRLKPDARSVDRAAGVFVSPVDGCVSELGPVEGGRLLQVKGVHYSLGDLVDDPALAERFEGGAFVTLYLRPKDYHRIHSPCAGRVVSTRSIAGRLLPVKPYMVRGQADLYVENERLVIQLDVEGGRLLLVCVAAAGVGNVSLARGPVDGRSGGYAVERGEEVAAFNLGSTVVVVFGPRSVRLEDLIAGNEIRMGKAIARSIDLASDSPAEVAAEEPRGR